MSTTIDAAGRVVIPKRVRDKMGLTPHTPVDITFEDGRIVIEYAPAEAWIDRSQGFPVLRRSTDGSAPPLTDEVIRETLEAVRDETLQHHL